MSVVPDRAPESAAIDATTGLALAVTIIAWASAFPAIRAGLASFGPLELGAIRFAIAALPAALFLLITRPAWPSLGELWRFVVGGLFFVALYTALLNIGERTVSAGAASFIINVNPIITAALALMLLGERFGRRAWLGTLISFLGIGLIALGEGKGLHVDAGALFILGAAVCNSVTTVAQKPLFARHRALTVSAWNMILGALFLSPWLMSGVAEIPAASTSALTAAVYLGLMPSLVAYGTWAVALSRLPAGRASNFMYCVPPVATAMGFLWLGEVPTLAGIVGGVMALAGVVIVNTSK